MRTIPPIGFALLACVAALATAGCDAVWSGFVGPVPPAGTTTVWVDPADTAASNRSSGPFGQALALPLTELVRTSIAGTLVGPDDAMTYQIGAIDPGDRLDVEVAAGDDRLDASVAVFDADLNLLAHNDDAYLLGRRSDAYIQFVAKNYSSQCYVVVSPSRRADTVGDYNLHVTLSHDATPPDEHPQIVYLQFHGGDNVVIGGRAPVDVPDFAGSMIDETFAGDTDQLRELLTARVRDDYLPYNVTILSSADGPPPSEPHTTVFFGSYNPTLLGIADNVDVNNARPVQEAIVFVDTFTVFMSQEPSVEAMVDALANVTSHEIGHLLGLHHTKDPSGIMDTSATLRQMLLPQRFRRGALNGDTFVVGFQDARAVLLDNVGGDAELAYGAEGSTLRARIADPIEDDAPAARDLLHFGSACTGH